MSAADTIADLVGAMRAAIVATRIEETRRRRTWPRCFPALSPDAMQQLGDELLSSGSEPPRPRQRLGGVNAWRCFDQSVLEGAGWRILPVPTLADGSDLIGPHIRWGREMEWIAIPPERSALAARRFKGPGYAQIWASECLAQAGGMHSGPGPSGGA